MKDHPVLYRKDWKRRAIPLVLHGDGVPLTGIGKSWSKLVDVFSVSSLLGRGSTRMRMFLIFSFFTSLSATADGITSSDRLFQRLVWSLFWAWRGKHPTHDDCNIECTDPLSEVVVFVVGAHQRCTNIIIAIIIIIISSTLAQDGVAWVYTISPRPRLPYFPAAPPPPSPTLLPPW